MASAADHQHGPGPREFPPADEARTGEEKLENDIDNTCAGDGSKVQFNLREFRADYYKTEAENLQTLHLARLAEVYHQRAKKENDQEKNWVNYLKAHTLMNSCLARDGPQKVSIWHPKIYKIEEDFQKGNLNLTHEQHRKKIITFKVELAKIRRQVKDRQAFVKPMIEKLDILNEFSDENKKLLKEMNALIFENSKYCTKEMQRFSGDIMRASEDIVGRPPCSYCAVALGSLAKGEATPYSDLEYIFLVESGDHRDYFHKLAVTSYFIIGDLGETPLKCVYLEEVHDHFGTKDEVRWFLEHTTNGFKIDGITPRAGNIPTGKGGPGDDKWTATPDEMISAYKNLLDKRCTLFKERLAGTSQSSVSMKWEDSIDKSKVMTNDMTDLLASAVMIHQSGKGEQLYDKYISKRNKIFTEFHTQRKELRESHVTQMKQDMDKYDFMPTYNAFNDSSSFKIKTDIFRYPTIILQNLKAIFDLNSTFSHDLVTELFKRQLIDQHMHFFLTVMLSSALHVRTAAYLAFESQKEELSFLTSHSIGTADRYYFPRPLFVVMAMSLVIVKYLSKINHNVLNFVLNGNDSFTIPNQSRCIKASILLFCGDFTRSLKCFQEYYNIEHIGDCEQTCKTIKEKVGKESKQEYLEQLLILFRIVKDDGQLIIVSPYSRKVVQAILEVYESKKGIDQLTREICSLADAMFREVGSCEPHQLLKFSHKALKKVTQLYGDESVFKAYLLSVIGAGYGKRREHRTEIQYHKRSLKMLQKIHGETSDHIDIANALLTIGTTFEEVREYQTAITYTIGTLEILQRRHGKTSDHPDIANALKKIGANYGEMGEYRKAIEYDERSLEMLQKKYGETRNHPDLTSALKRIGVNYGKVGENRKAIEYHQKLLEMLRRVPGETSDHPDIVDTLSYVDVINREIEKYKEAIEHSEKITGNAAQNTWGDK